MAVSTIKGSNIYHFSKELTLGANAQVTLDMSDVIPSGTSIKGMLSAKYGDYNLPYIEGTKFTYVYTMVGSNVRLVNTSSAWGSRIFEGYLIAE